MYHFYIFIYFSLYVYIWLKKWYTSKQFSWKRNFLKNKNVFESHTIFHFLKNSFFSQNSLMCIIFSANTIHITTFFYPLMCRIEKNIARIFQIQRFFKIFFWKKKIPGIFRIRIGNVFYYTIINIFIYLYSYYYQYFINIYINKISKKSRIKNIWNVIWNISLIGWNINKNKSIVQNNGIKYNI